MLGDTKPQKRTSSCPFPPAIPALCCARLNHPKTGHFLQGAVPSMLNAAAWGTAALTLVLPLSSLSMCPKFTPVTACTPMLLLGSCFTLQTRLAEKGSAVGSGNGDYPLLPVSGKHWSCPQWDVLTQGLFVFFAIWISSRVCQFVPSVNVFPKEPQVLPGQTPQPRGDRAGQWGLDRVTCQAAFELSSSCISFSKCGFHQAYLSCWTIWLDRFRVFFHVMTKTG